MRIVVVCVLLASGTAAAQAPPLPDDLQRERPQRVERALAYPPQPVDRDLVAIRVPVVTDYRFLVDTRSIAIEPNGIIRFSVVTQSPAGARTVTYEGLDCPNRERRVYAYGRGDSGWAESRSSAWQPFSPRNQNYWAVLYNEIFCPEATPIASVREGVDALRFGAHPRALRPAN